MTLIGLSKPNYRVIGQIAEEKTVFDILLYSELSPLIMKCPVLTNSMVEYPMYCIWKERESAGESEFNISLAMEPTSPVVGHANTPGSYFIELADGRVYRKWQLRVRKPGVESEHTNQNAQAPQPRQPCVCLQTAHWLVVAVELRSEEHTSELQSRETISYAVFCLKKKKKKKKSNRVYTNRLSAVI